MTRGQEVFIYRKEAGAEVLYTRYGLAEPLYGSQAHVERDGSILIPRWRLIDRERVNPEEFGLLSESRYSDEAYFRSGLITKEPLVLEIAEVKDDEGGVEAALRMTEYVVRGQKNVEQQQVQVVLERTRYLEMLFSQHEISGIPEEARTALQQETITLLSEAGLDPNQVRLETKRMMALWLIKASKGEDSLQRINEMITWQGLQAVERRAMRREIAVSGNIVAKYSEIGAALAVARSMDRMILVDVGEEIERHLLRNIYLTKPSAPIWRDYAYTIQKIEGLSWLLGETKVKPYRLVALETKDKLEVAKQLLDERRRDELFAGGLIGGIAESAEKFRETLNQHAEIG